MVIIRKSIKKDYKKIYALNKEWFNEGISPKTVNWTEGQFVRQLDRSTVYVAIVDEQIVGFVMIKVRVAKEENTLHNIYKGEKYVDLDSLYVKKKFRRKGIGTKLLQQVIKDVKKVGYKKIITSADSLKMKKLVKFYEKQGFETLYVRLMLQTRK